MSLFKFRRDKMRRYLSTIFLAVPIAVWAGEAAPREPLRLSLKRAVEIATSPEGNTYIQLSDENVNQAKSRSAEARSAFLPDIEAQAAQTTAMRSLGVSARYRSPSRANHRHAQPGRPGLGLGHRPGANECRERSNRHLCPDRKRSAEHNHQRYSPRDRPLQFRGRACQGHAERI